MKYLNPATEKISRPQKTLEFIIQLQFHYPTSIIINNCDHSVSISYDSEDSRINNIIYRIASSIITSYRHGNLLVRFVYLNSIKSTYSVYYRASLFIDARFQRTVRSLSPSNHFTTTSTRKTNNLSQHGVRGVCEIVRIPLSPDEELVCLDRQRDIGSVLETPCLWQRKDTGLEGTSNGIRTGSQHPDDRGILGVARVSRVHRAILKSISQYTGLHTNIHPQI